MNLFGLGRTLATGRLLTKPCMSEVVVEVGHVSQRSRAVAKKVGEGLLQLKCVIR